MHKFILSAVLLISIGANAQLGGEIRGTVTDSSGRGLAVVRIDVLNRYGAKQGRSAHTDIDGRYAMDNLRPGFYSLQFSSRGYVVMVVNGILVNQDATTAIQVILKPSTGKEVQVVQFVKPLLDFQRVIIE